MAPDLNCISPELLMEGYLKKPKKWNKRYFVLREDPPRLEYYDSQKRKANTKPKKVIELKNVWNVDKKVSIKQKFLIGIYTEEEYFAMAADSDAIQSCWVNALHKAILGYRGDPTRSNLMYKHIWQGNVETKYLESCDPKRKENLHGTQRCCLTDTSMVFFQVNSNGGCNVDAQSHIEVAIASIRSCGHKDNVFIMEPGRSSGIGTGRLWMELDDIAIAQNMHRTILAIMNQNRLQDDSRQRSYSFGSTNSRSSGNRSTRHYYCPPPSQVGLRSQRAPAAPKQPTNYSSMALPPRTRCESFPATQAASLNNESRYRADSAGENELRYRTASDGAATMKRHYLTNPWRKIGSISPHPRSRILHNSKMPLHLQQTLLHYRTSSLPGSYTSSSSSSMEQINLQDFLQSEGIGSSDEYVGSFLTDPRFNALCTGSAPPPPDTDPEPVPNIFNKIANSTVQNSDNGLVQSSHSRSQSIDDNLSCSTGASSLSTSPHVALYLSAGTSPAQGTSYMCHINTPISSSPQEYALMSPGGGCEQLSMSITDQLSSEYTCMIPGKLASSTSPSEDKSGYVPMRPLTRSQPQDIIVTARRRSLSENRISINGGYSPLSISPEKTAQLNKSSPGRSCDCHREAHCFCDVTTTKETSSPMLTHGLKEDMNCDVSFDANQSNQHKSPNDSHSSINYEEYACMDGFSRGAGDMPSRTSPFPNEETKENHPIIDHEYLPMSPVNVGNSKKSVVGNVLSIAQSGSKKSTSPTPGYYNSLKYPHQRSVNSSLHSNSLERPTRRRRNTMSSRCPPIFSSHRNALRGSNHGRRSSTRITNLEIKSASPANESSGNPPLSPGGDYVSIDYDKAKKQVGPDYVSLTESDVDDNLNDSSERIRVTHDSNRNILPNVDITAKNEMPKSDLRVRHSP